MPRAPEILDDALGARQIGDLRGLRDLEQELVLVRARLQESLKRRDESIASERAAGEVYGKPQLRAFLPRIHEGEDALAHREIQLFDHADAFGELHQLRGRSLALEPREHLVVMQPAIAEGDHRLKHDAEPLLADRAAHL